MLKVLGQSSPAAITATDVYTVPGATAAVLSTLSICNQNNSNVTCRVAVRVGGASLASAQYLLYDAPLGKNDALFLTIGAALGAGDVVTVYASSTGVSFNLFGSEVS